MGLKDVHSFISGCAFFNLTFETGFWNAWIFMLYNFLPTPLLMIIHKGALGKEQSEPQSKTGTKLHYIIWIMWLLAFAYSVFLPLKTGTGWFYTGFPVAIIGSIAFTSVIITFAAIPIENKPLTSGLYRYSRHPMYITQFVMFTGVSIAAASCVFLLFSIVYTYLSFITAIPEERSCLEKYGDVYREYMNKTPRWIGIPKSGEKRESKIAL